jgi:hypothetical protein
MFTDPHHLITDPHDGITDPHDGISDPRLPSTVDNGQGRQQARPAAATKAGSRRDQHQATSKKAQPTARNAKHRQQRQQATPAGEQVQATSKNISPVGRVSNVNSRQPRTSVEAIAVDAPTPHAATTSGRIRDQHCLATRSRTVAAPRGVTNEADRNDRRHRRVKDRRHGTPATPRRPAKACESLQIKKETYIEGYQDAQNSSALVTRISESPLRGVRNYNPNFQERRRPR